MNLYTLLVAYLTVILLWACSIFQSRVIRQLRADLRASRAETLRAQEGVRAAIGEWLRLARAIDPTHPCVQRLARLLAQAEADAFLSKARSGAAAKGGCSGRTVAS